jgi:hypothetical protein
MPRASQAIGFSVSVRLEWLEQAAALVSLGRTPKEVRANLHEIIGDERLADPTKKADSRSRTISVISTLWAEPPEGLVGLRDRGIDLLPSVPTPQHLALHWGMSMAAYPFFTCVAENTGRLLRLQGSTPGSDVYRRVVEEYGERQTTRRATSLLLATLTQWGALEGSSLGKPMEQTVFGLQRSVELGGPVSAWLVEAVLRSSGRETTGLQELLGSPALFPFRLSESIQGALETAPTVSVVALGVSDVSVMLRTETPSNLP